MEMEMEKQRNNTPLVSIVAPVYNIELYLPAFIQGVLKQTYDNWELLLIDDGSEDRSGVICDEYAQADCRIRVFHKPNGGVSSARNVGLKNMKGDWVMIPDPDDELPNNAIETYLEFATDDIDLVSAFYTFYRNGELMTPARKCREGRYTVSEFVALMGIVPQPRNVDRRCVNKLFRASIIKDNNIFFQEDIYYREDILYIYQFLSRCTRFVKCITQSLYTYFMRSSGAAISLQESYSPKSAGKFIAMGRCYGLLEQMNAESVVKKRMRVEMVKAYNAIVDLIKTEPRWGEDFYMFNRSAREYFSLREILRINAGRLVRKMKSKENTSKSR